mmetsp:Transcript_70474/g.223263  ORF Transcript_70474/g.223263 Transcript_70474/m.223263 type:complete len:207 (-) Transcript_70474:384-1004(-)
MYVMARTSRLPWSTVGLSTHPHVGNPPWFAHTRSPPTTAATPATARARAACAPRRGAAARAAEDASHTMITGRAANPISLESMASTASAKAAAARPRCHASSDSVTRSPQRSSARPTTEATASTCTGWSAKSMAATFGIMTHFRVSSSPSSPQTPPPARGLHHARQSSRKEKEVAAWRSTLPAWYPHGSSPPSRWLRRKESTVRGR